MMKSMVAPRNRREYHPDAIFGVNALAQEAMVKYGKDKVVSGTIGAIFDENEEPVLFETVEKVFRNIDRVDINQYAPIAGLPDFLQAVEEECFGSYRPQGFIKSIGVAGGTGGIHHLIHLYSEVGDEILTADWYWGAYATLCADRYRSLATYKLLDDNFHFNHESFQNEVLRLSQKQKNIVLIMNTPAHNPTGYTISGDDWDKILSFLTRVSNKGEHNIIIGVDVAYLDYAENGEKAREMFKKFENLPEGILTLVVYSLSKGFTLYGQRVGALIGISANQDIVDEFFHASEFSCRSCWSNLTRPAMRTMTTICKDPILKKAYLEERETYNRLMNERANIFIDEAKDCELIVLPYHGGFFISVPTDKAEEVCHELNKENIFLVPMKKGIRIAVSAIPKKKIKGLAQKVKEAEERIG